MKKKQLVKALIISFMFYYLMSPLFAKPDDGFKVHPDTLSSLVKATENIKEITHPKNLAPTIILTSSCIVIIMGLYNIGIKDRETMSSVSISGGTATLLLSWAYIFWPSNQATKKNEPQK
jgi:hypothetical protein